MTIFQVSTLRNKTMKVKLYDFQYIYIYFSTAHFAHCSKQFTLYHLHSIDADRLEQIQHSSPFSVLYKHVIEYECVREYMIQRLLSCIKTCHICCMGGELVNLFVQTHNVRGNFIKYVSIKVVIYMNIMFHNWYNCVVVYEYIESVRIVFMGLKSYSGCENKKIKHTEILRW